METQDSCVHQDKY